jgi:predicted MFS family arabinose efflux permease
VPTLQRITRRLFIFQIFLLLTGAAGITWLASSTFESDLEPEMLRKGATVARSLTGQFDRALRYEVPLHRLTGVEELFASVAAGNPEITFIAALDPEGRVLFRSGEDLGQDLEELSRSLAGRDLRRVAGEAVLDDIRVADSLVIAKPILGETGVVATVAVGIDGLFVQDRVREILLDLLIVLIVSLLLTFEFLIIITSSVSEPMRLLRSLLGNLQEGRITEIAVPVRGGEMTPILRGLSELVGWVGTRCESLRQRARIERYGESETERLMAGLPVGADPQATAKSGAGRATSSPVLIRAPLFVFFFAEELSRSFFPIFARQFESPIPGLSPEVVISLPMVLFMLIVALSQPFGGVWADRFGPKRLLLLGAVIGAVGLAFTATAWCLSMLLLWRAVTALGYGLVFVAGQSYVVANTDSSNRSWGMAMFVGAVLAASICGPAIGGILAERIGFRATFAGGAGLAVLSGLLAAYLLQPGSATVNRAARSLRWSDLGVVLRSRRFLGLVFLGAVPAKIVLTGFLYFLAPLYLEQLGNSQSAIGRIMMLYGLAMVLLTPISASLCDRLGRPLPFVLFGGFFSGAGLIAATYYPGTHVMVIGILVLGIAQAASVAPQLALIPQACQAECQQIGQGSVMGFFRLFERLGSALGPAIAAVLLGQYGYAGAFLAIGLMLVGVSLLLMLAGNTVTRPASLQPSPG